MGQQNQHFLHRIMGNFRFRMFDQILSDHLRPDKQGLLGATLSQLLQLTSRHTRRRSRNKKDTCLILSIYSFTQYKDSLFDVTMLSTFIPLLSFSSPPLTSLLLVSSVLQIHIPISYSTNKGIVQRSNRVLSNRPNKFRSSRHMSHKICAEPGS